MSGARLNQTLSGRPDDREHADLRFEVSFEISRDEAARLGAQGGLLPIPDVMMRSFANDIEQYLGLPASQWETTA